MHTTSTGQWYQNYLLSNPCTSSQMAQAQPPQIGTNCNNPMPRFTGVMREFMKRLDEVLYTHTTNANILNSGIADLLYIAQKYISKQFPKSSFLENVLNKCSQVPVAQKTTVLRIWVQIKIDPDIALIDSTSRGQDNVLINNFKRKFIDTLSELKSDQFFDMLRIRKNVGLGLPHTNFSDLDYELNRRPYIRKIFQDQPELCPPTYNTNQQQPFSSVWENGKCPFSNATTPSFMGTSTNQISSCVNTMPQTYASSVGLSTLNYPQLPTRICNVGYQNTMTSLPVGFIPSINPNLITETIRKLDVELEILFKPYNFKAGKAAQKPIVEKLVKIIRSGCRTPTCKFGILNHLIAESQKKKNKNFFCSKRYGNQFLWTICEVLNDPAFEHSAQDVKQSGFNVLALQRWFNSVFALYKKKEFQEFVAIRQCLSKCLHCALDIIDIHAFSKRGISYWNEFVAQPSVMTPQDFIPGYVSLAHSSSLIGGWGPNQNDFNLANAVSKPQVYYPQVNEQIFPTTTTCEKSRTKITLSDYYKKVGPKIPNLGLEPQLSPVQFEADESSDPKIDDVVSVGVKSPAPIFIQPIQSRIKSFVDCREEAARIQAEKNKEEQKKAETNKDWFERTFFGGDKISRDIEKETKKESQSSTDINETNLNPMKVIITPQPKPVGEAFMLQHSKPGSTSFSGSSGISNCKTSNTKTKDNASEGGGSSWTAASIIPTHRQGVPVSKPQNICTVKPFNGLPISNNKPKLSKLEELRQKLSKDEAITTLSSMSPLPKKGRTMIILKEDFSAEEYVDYICSPRLRSVSLIKVLGKYRIKIAHYPISASEPDNPPSHDC